MTYECVAESQVCSRFFVMGSSSLEASDLVGLNYFERVYYLGIELHSRFFFNSEHCALGAQNAR